MTLSAQLQSALTPVISLGDGTMHLPPVRLQAEQGLRGDSEDEPFAHVFARELSKLSATTVAKQPKLSLTGVAPSPVVAQDSGDADAAAALPFVQAIPLTEAVFESAVDLDEPIDFYQEEGRDVSHQLDLSWTPHPVIHDEITVSVLPNPVVSAPVWDGAVVVAMASPLFVPSSFEAKGRPISSELAGDVRGGAKVQDHLPMLGPPSKQPLSLLSSALSGQPKPIDVQAVQTMASLTQAPPIRADQMPSQLTPTDVLLAAPSDVAVSVGGGRPKEYTHTSTGMPNFAKGSVDQIQVAPDSQEAALLKPVAQDKFSVNLSPVPLQPMPHTQPGVYVAAPVLPQPISNKPHLSAKNPVGLVQDWQATLPVTPVVQTKTILDAGKDQLAGAEYTPILNLQTGGLGRADAHAVQPDPQRPELPRATVQQLVDASVRATERPVELVLNPEDLGRVRISMSMTDASVTLNLGAERSETLELLRRYSEILAQELRDLGYGKISFSFGQHGHGHGPHSESTKAAKVAADESLAAVVVNEAPRPLQTGLDIRL